MSSGGRYLPRSKRPGYVPSASSAPPPTARGGQTRASHVDVQTYNISDLRNNFNHPRPSTLTYFGYSYLTYTRPPESEYNRTRAPENNRFASRPTATRSASSTGPPTRYGSETGAERLVKDWEMGQKKNFGRPLPVFEEWKGRREKFIFVGWWQIDDLQVVPAHSTELTRMMQFKEKSRGFSRSGRTAEAWKDTMRTLWLKLKLAQVKGEFKSPHQLSKGEGETYLLEIGGLSEELEIFNGAVDGQ